MPGILLTVVFLALGIWIGIEYERKHKGVLMSKYVKVVLIYESENDSELDEIYKTVKESIKVLKPAADFYNVEKCDTGKEEVFNNALEH